MEGISKETLNKHIKRLHGCDGYHNRAVELSFCYTLLSECTELNPWLPIDENTPKDIPLLLKANCGVAVEGSFNGCYWEEHFLHTEIRPTHYQELPDDPKEQHHAKNS